MGCPCQGAPCYKTDDNRRWSRSTGKSRRAPTEDLPLQCHAANTYHAEGYEHVASGRRLQCIDSTDAQHKPAQLAALNERHPPAIQVRFLFYYPIATQLASAFTVFQTNSMNSLLGSSCSPVVAPGPQFYTPVVPTPTASCIIWLGIYSTKR